MIKHSLQNLMDIMEETDARTVSILNYLRIHSVEETSKQFRLPEEKIRSILNKYGKEKKK